MFYIDSFKHPYVQLEKEIILPSVSLVNFEPLEAKKIYQLLIDYFPSFTEDFKIIHQDQIIGQKKYYSFIKIFNYLNYYIALELKILCSYAGGADKNEILNSNIQNYSPSFITNKLYYFLHFYISVTYDIKNHLIFNIKGLSIPEIQNYVIPYTDTKGERWATSLFDETDFSELLDYFLSKFSYEWKLKFWKKPFLIEKSTLAMNLIDIRQLQYLVEPYIKFIEEYSKVEKWNNEIFIKYFQEWKYEICFSKNGNLLWKLLKIPFIDS